MRRWPLVLLMTLACAGCIRSTTLVTLRPDGSGTIDQQTGVKPEMVAMLKGFAQSSGKAGNADLSKGLFTEQQARDAAAKMGVRFVSGEPVKTADMEGYHARYAFDDITKVIMSMNQSTSSMGGSDAPSSKEPPFAFAFTRGASSSVLTIHLPDQKNASPLAQLPGGDDKDPQQAQQMLGMMSGMMAGLYIDVALALDGHIVKTDAPFVTGNRVTLMQMDFDTMMKDPTALQKLQNSKSLAALQGVPGLKVIGSPTVTIEFAK
ncbi:MAG TPA: hypothetical protein VFX12_05695 [Vicinamibacterales bacterium]|nr:hypothetical protein [Vicinamibacterales bacterium]